MQRVDYFKPRSRSGVRREALLLPIFLLFLVFSRRLLSVRVSAWEN